MEKFDFSFNVCRYVKSNAIVLAHEDSVGIGSGQPVDWTVVNSN